MKRTILIGFVLATFSMTTFAYAAQTSNVCTWAQSKNWAVSAPGKLVRGLVNTGLGWSELFVQPFKEDSVMSGIGKGLSDFFVRTFQGICEIMLFWLPPVPNEPLHECVFYDWGLLERSS